MGGRIEQKLLARCEVQLPMLGLRLLRRRLALGWRLCLCCGLRGSFRFGGSLHGCSLCCGFCFSGSLCIGCGLCGSFCFGGSLGSCGLFDSFCFSGGLGNCGLFGSFCLGRGFCFSGS